MRDYVDGWVDGWAWSRGTSPPERVKGGWYVATRTDREHGRFVLSAPTPKLVAAIVDQGQPPRTWVMLPGEPEEWLPRFGTGWEPDHAGWFMTRALGRPLGRRPPLGYEVTLDAAPRVVVAQVLAPEGNAVCSGRMGLGASYAVADQIVTDQRHRRLGLGTVVMAVLERHALEAGLGRAVLAATGDGRSLYQRLGWDAGAPLTAVYSRPG